MQSSSECDGWEDVFVQKAWERFESVTTKETAPEKAGAFVKWWIKGEFKDRLFSDIMEKMIAVKREKQQGDQRNFKNREAARTMTNADFEIWYEKRTKGEVKSPPSPSDSLRKPREGMQQIGDVVKKIQQQKE